MKVNIEFIIMEKIDVSRYMKCSSRSVLRGTQATVDRLVEMGLFYEVRQEFSDYMRNMQRENSYVNRLFFERCRYGVGSAISSFLWSRSKRGDSYWRSLYNKLP